MVQAGERRGTLSGSHLFAAAAVLVLFFASYFGARAFGVWDNKISDTEYVQRIQENRIDPYGHPGM